MMAATIFRICGSIKDHHVLKKLVFVNQRVLSCRRSNSSRPYQDNENAYYRQALENLSPQYCPSNYIAGLNLNTSLPSVADMEFAIKRNFFDFSPNVVLEKFLLASRSVNSNSTMTLEDPNIQPVCKSLVVTMSKFSDDQLYEVLLCLTKWSFASSTTRSKSYKSVWNTLDREFCARCSDWSTSDLLKVAHGWDALALSRITNYNYTMIDILGRRVKSLNLKEFIHLFYFINLQRKISADKLLAIEKELLTRNIDQLELDELGVIALGYFKTQSSIKSARLIQKLLTKVEKNFDKVNDFNLTSIVKAIRFDLPPKMTRELNQFQKLSLEHISKFSSSTLLHLSFLSMRCTACNEDLLKLMISSFSRDIKSLRLKELVMSLFCASQILAHEQLSKDYALKLVHEATLPERAEEILKYPHQLVSLLSYATHFNVFSQHLIDKCLNVDFLTSSDENARWQWEREAFSIDRSVDLECPEYKGSRLSKARAAAIYKRNYSSDNLKTDTVHSRFVEDIFQKVSTYVGGKDFCKICEILPHFHHKDLIVVKDKEGKWKKVPELLKEGADPVPIFPNKDEQWFAIFVGGRAYYNLTNYQLIGSYKMKCRQLSKLGFIVIQLHYYEYSKLNEPEKITYLVNKLTNYSS